MRAGKLMLSVSAQQWQASVLQRGLWTSMFLQISAVILRGEDRTYSSFYIYLCMKGRRKEWGWLTLRSDWGGEEDEDAADAGRSFVRPDSHFFILRSARVSWKLAWSSVIYFVTTLKTTVSKRKETQVLLWNLKGSWVSAELSRTSRCSQNHPGVRVRALLNLSDFLLIVP